jgi:hypothetical protein
MAGCVVDAGDGAGAGSRVTLSNTSASTLRSSGRRSATSGGIAPAISAKNVGTSGTFDLDVAALDVTVPTRCRLAAFSVSTFDADSAAGI